MSDNIIEQISLKSDDSVSTMQRYILSDLHLSFSILVIEAYMGDLYLYCTFLSS